MVQDLKFNFIFLGLAQNCEPFIPNLFKFLDEIEGAGYSCRVLVGENGSSDSTRSLLEEGARSRNMDVFNTDFMRKVPSRLARMAEGRQHLKSKIEDLNIEADYVCVLDLDTVMTRVPQVEKFINTSVKLGNSAEDYFAASAVSKPHYYDLIAYEDEKENFEHHLIEAREAQKNPITYYWKMKRIVDEPKLRLTTSHDRSCISAFNGMALYLYADYLEGIYTGPREICEHLVFNRVLHERTGKRMLVCTDIELATPADHQNCGFIPFWFRRIKKLPRYFR